VEFGAARRHRNQTRLISCNASIACIGSAILRYVAAAFVAEINHALMIAADFAPFLSPFRVVPYRSTVFILLTLTLGGGNSLHLPYRPLSSSLPSPLQVGCRCLGSALAPPALFRASFGNCKFRGGGGKFVHPTKLAISPSRSSCQIVCSKSFFSPGQRITNISRELSVKDNKHRKLFVIKQSKG